MIGQDYIANKVEADLFPQGEEANKNVVRRRRKGSLWRGGFFGSTIVTIVILSILLLKILNDTSGLVAEESEIPERELLLTFGEAQVIGAPNIVLASEQDLELAAGVAEDPNGLGFVPWSAYLSQADNVRLLAVDGVQPGADTVESGAYPFTRPLYLYAASSVLEQKPRLPHFCPTTCSIWTRW